MKTILFFTTIVGLYYLLASPYYYRSISEMELDIKPEYVILGTSLIFAAITVFAANFFYNRKEEGFFFELTPNRPICSKNTTGRPIGFEFTPQELRTNPGTCGPTCGYDGFLAANVCQTCTAGGCTCCNQQKQVEEKFRYFRR